MAKKKTFDELMAAYNKAATAKHRKRPADEEHRLQCACVRWFAYQHPELQGRLFAVPNGGRRDAVTGAKLKAEGVTVGVSDLILLKSNSHYGALLIEMKTDTGRQSEGQKRWQNTVCAEGEYKYVVCRSVDDFRREVDEYLKDAEDL